MIGTRGILKKIKTTQRENVKVVFGSPILTKGGDDIERTTEKVMQEIKKLLPPDY